MGACENSDSHRAPPEHRFGVINSRLQRWDVWMPRTLDSGVPPQTEWMSRCRGELPQSQNVDHHTTAPHEGQRRDAAHMFLCRNTQKPHCDANYQRYRQCGKLSAEEYLRRYLAIPAGQE